MACAKIGTKHVLITGVPGIGKTTLMVKLHKELEKKGVACSGFITEEVRSGGRRIGFDVVTVDGQRGQLARVSDSSTSVPGTNRREYKVGQYSVNLLSFEQTALPTLHRQTKESSADNGCVVLVDEIGKMELFSQNFVQAVRKLMSQPHTTMVATIPVPKGRPIPFVEELRSSADSLVFEVTRDNRDSILSDVLAAVQSSLDRLKSR